MYESLLLELEVTSSRNPCLTLFSLLSSWMCTFLWPHHPCSKQHWSFASYTSRWLPPEKDWLPFFSPSFSFSFLFWGFKPTVVNSRILPLNYTTKPKVFEAEWPNLTFNSWYWSSCFSFPAGFLCHQALQERFTDCFFIYVYLTLCVWKSKNNFKKLVLSFQRVGSRDQTHVIRLKNCLYSWNNCHGPRNNFLIACLFNPIIWETLK